MREDASVLSCFVKGLIARIRFSEVPVLPREHKGTNNNSYLRSFLGELGARTHFFGAPFGPKTVLKYCIEGRQPRNPQLLALHLDQLCHFHACIDNSSQAAAKALSMVCPGKSAKIHFKQQLARFSESNRRCSKALSPEPAFRRCPFCPRRPSNKAQKATNKMSSLRRFLRELGARTHFFRGTLL